MRPIRAALVASSIAALLATSCGGLDPGGSGGRSPGHLDGRIFLSTSVLEHGVERPLVPGTRIRLGFAEGQISVQAGCNSMSGEYALDDGVLRLPGPMSMTEMGCDPGRMEQDEWIAGFVGSSPRVGLDGARLTLSRSGTVIELLDREVADPDRPLVGTVWHLESIVQDEAVSSVPADLGATMEFLQDGTVRLDTGCNAGGGPVTVGAGTLSFGALALTARGCEPDASALEEQILGVLRGDVSYAIDGPMLSLRAGELGLDWRA